MDFDAFYHQICTRELEQFNNVTKEKIRSYIREVYIEFKRIYNECPDILLIEDISNFCTSKMVNNHIIPKFLSFEGYTLRQRCDDRQTSETHPKTDDVTTMISDIQNIYANCQRVQCDKIKCRRCRSVDIFQYSVQTRSADEPTSEYVECLACNYSWRMA